MNLVYLSSSRIPSIEANSIHVMKMAEAFAENGNLTKVFASSGGCSDMGTVFRYYGVNTSFDVEFCLRPSISQFGSVVYGFGVAKACRTIEADLFYGRCPHSLYFASFLKKPFIYEAHDFPKRTFRKALESKLFSKPDFKRLVVISEALRKDYVRTFKTLHDGNVLVAHDGANVPKNAFFSNYTESRVSDGKNLNIGYVGSLFPGKGVEGVISLACVRPQHFFHIVGGPNAKAAMWKIQAPENVRFYGRIDPANTFEVMRSFDVLLLPAKNKIETSGGGDIAAYTSPLKMFEYMAAGRPMIASRLPVLEEVLVHGRNALLAAPDEVQEWCEALDSLAKDKKLMESLATNALDDLRTKYSWQIRAAAVLDGIS